MFAWYAGNMNYPWFRPSEVHTAVQMYGEAQGIKLRCVQIPKSDYRQLWGVWGELMDTTNEYLEFMDGRGFSSVDERVLSKEDLGVQGLESLAAAGFQISCR